MSLKLKELQEIAEAKGKEYFREKGYDCLPSTLLAINDAMKEVDDINYADPLLLKATCPLPAGFGAWEGPCGAVTAGSIAIGLKFGSSNMGDLSTIRSAWNRSGQWLRWFKYQQFGSYNCSDIKGAPFDYDRCTNFVTQSAKKIVDILTEEDPRVLR